MVGKNVVVGWLVGGLKLWEIFVAASVGRVTVATGLGEGPYHGVSLIDSSRRFSSITRMHGIQAHKVRQDSTFRERRS